MQVNKGIYVKLGQHVAQLEYLLPQQYVDTLTATLTQAPQDDFSAVKRVVEQDLGASIDEVFEDFEEEPIASASLAQVHRARLRSTGELVAVKVQHEGLRELSQVDIATISALVDLVKAIFPSFEFTWLADEIKINLPRELDFTLEGANAERTAANFRGDERVAVPRIVWEHSSPRVLTMSFEEGCYITNVQAIKEQGLQPADVAATFADVFSKQIFMHGFVHADPHAGNVLVRHIPGAPGKPQLVLLDHGLYRPLDDAFRVRYARLWRALIFGDEEGIKEVSAEMGVEGMHRLFAAILTTKTWDSVSSSSLDSLVARGTAEEKELTSQQAKEWSDDIRVILKDLPPEMLLLLKTNDCLRAVDLALGARVNGFTSMALDCVDAIAADTLARDKSWSTWLSVQADLWQVWAVISAYKWSAYLFPPPQAPVRQQAATQLAPSTQTQGEQR